MLLYFPTVLVQGVMGLVTAALLTRLFPPEEYGLWALAFAVYSQLLLLTGGWLRQSILRLTPEYRQRNQFEALIHSLVLSESFLLTTVFSVGFVVLVFLEPSFDPRLFGLLLVALIGASFAPLASAVEEFLRIVDRPAQYSLLVLFRSASSLLVGVLFAVYLKVGIVGFFAGFILPSVGIVVAVALARGGRLLAIARTHSFSPSILRDALTYSIPLVAMNALSSILALADRYFINWFQGPFDVAVYSIGYLIANQGIIFATLLLTRAGDPVVVRTWEEEGPSAAGGYLNQIFRYYTLLAIPALFGLVTLGRELIRLLSTPEYMGGFAVIGIVGLGVFFSGYSQIFNRVFGLRKRTLIPLFSFAIAAGVNVLLNSLFVPRYGFMAAAWTTLLSYLVLFLINSFMAGRLMELRPFGSYVLKALAASAIMSAVILWLKTFLSGLVATVSCSILVGILTYAGMLLLMGERMPPLFRDPVTISDRFRRRER
jgi:O-antigen/teichoic acid export membrane protein